MAIAAVLGGLGASAAAQGGNTTTIAFQGLLAAPVRL